MDALRINNQEFDVETAQKMIDAGLLGAGQKHDTSSSTPSATPLNGPFPGNNLQYGIFSGAGVRPGMWNATPRVRSISQYIPMYKSTIWNELIDVATGVTVGSGTNAVSACTVGPKPGVLAKMQIAATFGIIHASTKIFDVTQVGAQRNRADVPREIYNQASVINPWLPQVPGIDGGNFAASAMRSEFMQLGIELERNISQVHFTGVAGVENNTYLGVARQWNGLDRLIRSGWTDNVSGVATPAADAQVVNFNGAIDATVNGRTIIAALIDTYYGQVDYMRRIGITPVYALVMRPELFRVLAQIWSCSYNTTRCISSNAGQPLVRDAVSVRNEYESMIAGEYLPMDGTNVPVILDDSIARETLGNNYYLSDIYGVMLSGNGIPTLFGEYFDMDNPQAQEIVNFAGGDDMGITVNDGMYRVFKRVTGGCKEFDFYARPRLVTTTPFAHFRVDNVFYNTYYNTKDAIPGFSNFPGTPGVTYLG